MVKPYSSLWLPDAVVMSGDSSLKTQHAEMIKGPSLYLPGTQQLPLRRHKKHPSVYCGHHKPILDCGTNPVSHPSSAWLRYPVKFLNCETSRHANLHALPNDSASYF